MAKMEAVEAENKAAESRIAELSQELAEQQQDAELEPLYIKPAFVELKDTLQAHWKIIAPLLLVMLAICFLLTKLIVEARIKSRFHGIKIW